MDAAKALSICDGNFMTVYGPEYKGFVVDETCPFCGAIKEDGKCTECDGDNVGRESGVLG